MGESAARETEALVFAAASSMWQGVRGALGGSRSSLLLLLVFIWHSRAEQQESVVVTKQGALRGTTLPSPSGPVTAFLGIPYAEPPTGALRFKKPVPVTPWQGIRDATKYGNSCYQNKDNQFPGYTGCKRWTANTALSEDCLHLNIWVPSTKPTNASVLAFIHGGGFETGTSTLDVYDGRILAQTEQVLVVSINYRLGALGFLALPGNLEIPGNAGLFDQQLALQWVHENIAAFGGNPYSVTLFGQSAGGGSVGYHVVSPSSHPFFTRAVMQSGTPNGQWAVLSHSEAKNKALKLFHLLGCVDEDDSEVLTCLRTKSAEEIVHSQNSVVPDQGFALTRFAPIVDGDFLTDTPDALIKLGKFKQGEILTGINADEGSVFIFYGPPGFNQQNESLLSRDQFQEEVKLFFLEGGQLGVESIIFQYTDWEDEHNQGKNRKALGDVLAESNFECPTASLAKDMSEHGNAVYLYLFDHRSSQEEWPEWAGVIHTAELPFLFGAPLEPAHKYTPAEEALSRKMMRSWSNFGKTGNPNGAEANESAWQKFTIKEQNYATLNTEPLQMKCKRHVKQCVFWNSYFPKVVQMTGRCAKNV